MEVIALVFVVIFVFELLILVAIVALTAATSVTVATETPATRSSSASILVAETIPKDWLAFRLTVPLVAIVVETTPSIVRLIPVPDVSFCIVPNAAEGTLTKNLPSPAKNPALTVPENSPEVAESLVKSIALTTIL
jgi:NhaP-type Na+/H+ and K+/H+ antiporter